MTLLYYGISMSQQRIGERKRLPQQTHHWVQVGTHGVSDTMKAELLSDWKVQFFRQCEEHNGHDIMVTLRSTHARASRGQRGKYELMLIKVPT